MKKWSASLLLAVLSSGWGVANAAERLDWIVAVVNDEVIVNSDLQGEMRSIVSNLRQQGTALPPQDVLQKQVLERMVTNRVQLQLASRTGIKVDDGTLNAALRQVAAQNQLSLEGFQEALAKEGVTYAEFREDLRDQLIIRRLQQRQVASQVTVTEREIDNALANQVRQGSGGHEYHLMHILIAVPEGASPELIAEKKARAEQVLGLLQEGADFKQTAVTYSNGQQAFEGGDLGWRKAGQLPALFADRLVKMKAGEVAGPFQNASGFHLIKLAELRGATQSIVTQTKARHILVQTNELVSDAEAESRLRQLKERAEAGDAFAALAKANSEDAASARDGGELGWISPGQMVPEFEEAMQNLKPGDVSEPFRSRYGWHIIQVEERRDHDNTEQALRSKASQQIRQRKMEEELDSWLRQLRDEAYVDYRQAEQGA